ncbi:MAG TPA: hypothetical protein VL094_03595 [Sphingomonadaceae bacterium]|nr:hypothetical protein [Sphingomonadaceae bacterium]
MRARAVELGGKIVFPRLDVPGVVVLGLIEWKGGKAVVPAVSGEIGSRSLRRPARETL